MNRFHIYSLLASLSWVSLAAAQVQQQPPDPRPSTSETEGTAADQTPPEGTATRPEGTATRPEGTATRPGRPGTQSGETQTDPRPSTSEGEGTAADRTPPGKTSTTSSPGTKPSAQRSELVGAAVVTPADAQIGKVVDVVFDAKGQPAFVVISSQGGEAAAVPYSVASSMKSGNKVVIDESRLQSAPKIRDGEWRSGSSSTWQRDATRFWEKG